MSLTTIIQPDIPVVTGLWEDKEKELFTQYRATIQFTGKVMGGIPQKPEIIESWLRQRVTGGDEEVRQMMVRTLDELGVDVADGMTMEELATAAKRVAQEQHGNTFYRDSKGLFLQDYHFKAALKENVAILYPYAEKGNRMGLTSKAAKAFWAERVFVDEPRVHLGRMEPDGTHLQIGHVPSPKGKKSTLTYYDYCENQESNPLYATFTMSSMQDMVKLDMWQNVLLSMQRNGIGAIRSMGYGQSKIVAFERV